MFKRSGSSRVFLQRVSILANTAQKLFKLVGALSKRNQPLVFDVTGQSLDPES